MLGLALLSTLSFADEAPPPKCPPGEHSEYRYGYKCVPNGMHLDEHGNIPVEAPSVDVHSLPQPSTTPPQPSSVPVRTVEPKRTSGCTVLQGDAPQGLGVFALGLACYYFATGYFASLRCKLRR